MTQIAICVFDGIEVLDFAAPYEVFSLATTKFKPGSGVVSAVGNTENTVRARNGLRLVPEAVAGVPDVVVLPGGPGVEVMLDDSAFMSWATRLTSAATRVLAICNGALFLARMGMLRHRVAITHFSDIQRLSELEPTVQIGVGSRFVKSDHIVTSAGISAGLDASLAMAADLWGQDIAAELATWMEYRGTDWKVSD